MDNERGVSNYTRNSRRLNSIRRYLLELRDDALQVHAYALADRAESAEVAITALQQTLKFRSKYGPTHGAVRH